MSNRRDWMHDIDALQTIATDEILPRWNSDDPHPERFWPTHEWLNQNGYSHLKWILREKHDLTVERFFTTIVGQQSEESRWDIDDPKTILHAERYLECKRKHRNWSDATAKTVFYLLNRVLSEFASEAGRSDLIALANQKEEYATETYITFVNVIYKIKEDASSDNSAYQYLRTGQRFFDYVDRRYLIEYNPMEGLYDEFRWNLDNEGSDPLTVDQVGALWEVAGTLEEYLILIGYIIWGLRRQEVTNITRSKFEYKDGEIFITFDDSDRKNAGATVKVRFGAQYVDEQFDQLKSHSQWNGHLLVQDDDPSKPMKPETAANRFRNLCERADVLIDDELPSPNNARATWHEFNARAEAAAREISETPAEAQAYDDIESIRGYQTQEFKEELRQKLFKKELKQRLPENAYEEDQIFVQGNYDLEDW